MLDFDLFRLYEYQTFGVILHVGGKPFQYVHQSRPFLLSGVICIHKDHSLQ